MNANEAPTSDPSTPGARPPPTALGAAMTTVTVGTPLAIVTVWALETFVTVHGHALQFDSTQACAIGSVGAGFIGYLMQVFQGLYSLIIERLTRP